MPLLKDQAHLFLSLSPETLPGDPTVSVEKVIEATQGKRGSETEICIEQNWCNN